MRTAGEFVRSHGHLTDYGRCYLSFIEFPLVVAMVYGTYKHLRLHLLLDVRGQYVACRYHYQ